MNSKFQWRPFGWNNLWAFFSGSMLERDRAELADLYARVKTSYERSPYGQEFAELDFIEALVAEAADRAAITLPEDFALGVKECIWALTQDDPVLFWMPDLPDNLTIESIASLHTILKAKERFLSDPPRYEAIWREKVIRVLEGFFGYLPPPSPDGQFSAAIVNICNVPEIVERIMVTMFDDDVVNTNLFTGIRDQFERNLVAASGLSFEEAKRRPSAIAKPRESKLPPREVASQYLYGTAFSRLFALSLPFSLPEQPRYEHQWVVAPQGSGKTQLLQSQIAKDLHRVAGGEASLIIIDSQGRNAGKDKKKARTLIQNLTELKVFAKGQPLEDRLVVLQPDIEHPLALNLFDMGQHNPDLSARDRQILHMSSLKMVWFCLAGTTDQQEDMIDYLVQLAMAVPNATIDTVRRMLAPKGIEEFRPYFDQVDVVVRDYFLHVFNTQSQNVTKEAVMRRIMGMLKNPTFRKMYQNQRNKFNMLRELDAGKVIVINTDMELLGKEACELFGRFFVSLLVQATQQRTNSKPVYCYIDECQDYIAADENIASLLDKARKQKVGFILAHQRLSNITSANVLDALSNVAIKFAGGNITDAPSLSRFMRATPEFISNQPRLSFAAFVRGQTPQAIQLSVEYGVMENMPRMTDEEQGELQQSMRERYSVSPSTPPAPGAPEPADDRPQWDDVV